MSERKQPVHLAVPHAVTGRIGIYLTPLNTKATKCQKQWDGGGSRTLMVELVTCEQCKKTDCGHLTAYRCMSCDTRCCMDCDEPVEGDEYKTAVRYCQAEACRQALRIANYGAKP